MKSRPSQREMVQAFQGRDTTYDGIFLVAVRTTGIFCKPSCPARKPLVRNVEFYPSVGKALAAGYRPCKRCRPMQTEADPPGWAATLLQSVQADPHSRIRDADLRARSIEPAMARRYFKRTYGMTFHAFQRSMRLGEALSRIRNGAGVTDVAIGHGYESDSGFRHSFNKVFGKTPGQSRGADCVLFRLIDSPVGPLLAGATSAAVCFLEFTDRRALETQVDRLRSHLKLPIVPGDNEPLRLLDEELRQYFDGTLRKFTVPIEYPGSDFQQAVWTQLLQIPYGQTISYAALAQRVGKAGASRAVGRANGQNRLAIVIPCHRVVNKNGQLGGYGGGLWRKQFLLDLEQKTLLA